MGVVEIIRHAVPLGLANMSVVFMPLIDSVMLSHYEVGSMSAGGMMFQFYAVLFVFGEGLLLGFSPVYGRYLESASAQAATDVHVATLSVVLVYWLLACSVMLLVPAFLGALGLSTGLIAGGQGYLWMLAIALLPNLLFMHYWEILAYHGKSQLVLLGAASQTIVNVLLNYCLIYGHLGLPEWGLIGAGVGTLVASIFGAIWLILILRLSMRPRLRHTYRSWGKTCSVRFGLAKEVVFLGVPIGISIVITVAFLALSVILMGRFTESYLAAHLAVLQMNEVVVVFALGFNEYCAVRMSSALSLPRKALVHFIQQAVIASLLVVGILVLLLYVFSRHVALAFFSTGPLTDELHQHMETFLAFSLPFLLVNAGVLVLAGVLRGMGETWAMLSAYLLGLWGVGLLAQVLAATLFPQMPLMVWAALQCGFIVTLVGLAFAVLRLEARFNA